MFNEDIFNFDINNIKNDLAIEGLTISDADITLFKQFVNNEIDMPNLIQTIKNEIKWIINNFEKRRWNFYFIFFLCISILNYTSLHFTTNLSVP